MKKVELLAPAGNYESFLGAIHAGADAVYLAGVKFGARAYADNFSTEQLCQAIRYAHLFGRKIYLTLNTLVKQAEFNEVAEYLEPFYLAGLDGVILQDIGVLSLVRRVFPLLPIHISTQLTVTGANAARMLKEEGAVRIVPARELSLEEIRFLKEQTGLEIEAFIHGAMCYCYSGQCLFSSILGGRSGNRGKCAQPCRLPYRICREGMEGAEQYPLSLKDMCTVEHIPQLIEAGIDSFKIEGRMKKPEYAAGVTAVYRKYIDRYYDSLAQSGSPQVGYSPRSAVEAHDRSLLSSLYIRSQVQDGYYYKHNGADMLTLQSPAYNGSEEALLKDIRKQYIESPLKLPVSLSATFHLGDAAELTLCCGDITVTEQGDIVQQADRQPVTRENLENGLSKMGNTIFRLTDMDIQMSDGIFYPLKAVNELRRKAAARLEDSLLTGYAKEHGLTGRSEYERQPAEPERNTQANTAVPAVHVLLQTKEQLQALLHFCSGDGVFSKPGRPDSAGIARLYLDADMAENTADWETLTASLRKALPDTEIFLSLPYIIRKRDIPFLSKLYPALAFLDGCLFRNMEGYAWLRSCGYQGKLAGDAGVYIWNRESLVFWKGKGIDTFCLPYELNQREQAAVTLPGIRREQIVYGTVAMMLTANCVAKTAGQCRRSAASGFYLKDRYQKHFPVYCNCRHCYNVLYNCVPLSLHGRLASMKAVDSIRLDFTLEDSRQTGRILEFFAAVFAGKQAEPPFAEYTTGHDKRGVE